MRLLAPALLLLALARSPAWAAPPEEMQDLPAAAGLMQSEKHTEWEPIGESFSGAYPPGLQVRVKIGGKNPSEWLGKPTTDYTMWPEFRNGGSQPIRLHLDKTRVEYQTRRRDRTGAALGAAPFVESLQGDKDRTILLMPGDTRGFTHVVQHFEQFCESCENPVPELFRMTFWAGADDRDAAWDSAKQQARALQSQQRFKEAIDLLWKASLDYNYKKDGDGEQLFDELKGQLQQQKADQAAAAEAAALQQKVGQLLQSGDGKRSSGNLQGALGDYRAARQLDPSNALVGERIQAVEQQIQAEQAAAQAQAAQQQALADARSAIQGKRFDQAESALARARDLGATSDQLRPLQEQLDQARQSSDFEKLLAEGNARAQAGDTAGAIARWEAALQVKDDPSLRSRIEQAKQLLAQAQGQDPGSQTDPAGANAQQDPNNTVVTLAGKPTWWATAQEGQARMRQGDYDGAIALFQKARSQAGNDPQAEQLDGLIQTCHDRKAQLARLEQIEAENERRREEWVAQQAAAEEEARRRNAQSIREAEAKAAAAHARAERQLQAVDTTAAYLQDRIQTWANNAHLRELVKESSNLNRSLTDPEEILRDYEEKAENLRAVAEQQREQFDQGFQELMQLFPDIAANANLTSQQAGLAAIGAGIGAAAAAAAQDQKRKAREEELRRQLREAFDRAKNELVGENQAGLADFGEAEAQALNWEEQAQHQEVAGFYACNIRYITSNYSYDHAGWARPNCSAPSSGGGGGGIVRTADERVALGRYKLERYRLGGAHSEAWLQSAELLADGAVAANRAHAGAWALKAELSRDWVDRLAFLERAAQLDPSWQSEVDANIPAFSTVFLQAVSAGDVAFMERAAEPGLHLLVRTPDGRSPVLVGIERNDGAMVRTLLDIYDIDLRSQGTALIHLATARDATSSLQALIDAGVAPHAPDEDGRTPYYVAVAAGAQQSTALLAGHRPDHLALVKLAQRLDEQSTAERLGVIALEQAIAAGTPEAADGLLRARPTLMQAPRGDRDSYASWAARSGEHGWMTLFLRRGTSSDAADRGGDPLLTLAVAEGHDEVAELLLSKGASPNARRATTGETALHHAVLRPDPTWVARLLKAGSAIDLPDGRGRTAVHAAVAASQGRSVETLLAEHPNLDLQDAEGNTPLHLALSMGSDGLIAALLPGTIDLAAQNQLGQAPLHLAIVGRKGSVVDQLIARGAPIEAQDGAGDTPLHLALRQGDTALGARLMDLGAPSTTANRAGETAFHLCAGVGDLPLVSRLFAEGHAVGLPTANGATPLHYSARVGSDAVSLFLLQRGADKKAKDSRNWTPVKEARKAGHDECAKLISKWKPPK